jgi:hypothetical protein
MVNWFIRRGYLLPPLFILLVVGLLVVMDRQQQWEVGAAERQAAATAERRAAMVADQIGNEVNKRMGALRAANPHASTRWTPSRSRGSWRPPTA